MGNGIVFCGNETVHSGKFPIKKKHLWKAEYTGLSSEFRLWIYADVCQMRNQMKVVEFSALRNSLLPVEPEQMFISAVSLFIHPNFEFKSIMLGNIQVNMY